MKPPAPIARWGGTLGVLLLAAVALSFPRRYELGPPWEETIFIITLLVAAVISVTSNLVKAPGSVSNAAILTVVGLMSIYNALALFQLVVFLVFPDANRAEIEAPRLLASAVSIWLTNVLLHCSTGRSTGEDRNVACAIQRVRATLRFRATLERRVTRSIFSWPSIRRPHLAQPIRCR